MVAIRVEITAPLKGFTGRVVDVDFRAGAAEITTDTDHGRAAYAYFERAGYRIVPVVDEAEQEQTKAPDAEPFDPSEHNADEVMAYLETADLEEAERVVQAECDGKARKGILTQSGPLLASKEGQNQ